MATQSALEVEDHGCLLLRRCLGGFGRRGLGLGLSLRGLGLGADCGLLLGEEADPWQRKGADVGSEALTSQALSLSA